MTVLQVQSLPVLAHQHRSIIFFWGFFWGFFLGGLAHWYGTHSMEMAFVLFIEQVLMMRHMSASSA
jgi:hypothetical protein